VSEWLVFQSASHVSQQRAEPSTARLQQLDQRRVLHLSSEKKRRSTIKVCSAVRRFVAPIITTVLSIF